MADERFKVRRQAYFERGITCASKITATGGINTTSGSVSTFAGGLTATSVVSFTGGLTAASTVAVTGCLISGTGGTTIAGILCGSAAVTIGANASTTSTTCFPVVGLTTSHKIFLSTGSMSGCFTVACPYCKAGTTPCLVFKADNITSEDKAAGTSTLFYLAILDK